MFGMLGSLLGNWPASGPAQSPGGGGPEEDKDDGERKRRQGLIQQDARAQQARNNAAQPMQAHGDWMHPAGREHFAHFGNMLNATNNAWQREMDNRTQQASEAAQRDHEYNIESMRQQGAMARAQHQQATDQQQEQRRQQKNAMIMNMAGMGGTTIVGDSNGIRVSPIGRSLLG